MTTGCKLKKQQVCANERMRNGLVQSRAPSCESPTCADRSLQFACKKTHSASGFLKGLLFC